MHSLRRLVPIAILSLIAFAACKLDPKNDTVGIYDIACNGVDDSDLITRAVDAINEANVPAELRFGPGRCANVGTITIRANGVVIKGSGPRISYLISSSATAPLIVSAARDFRIEGLSLSRKVIASPGADGIDACLRATCAEPNISDVEVTKSYVGIHLGPVVYGHLIHSIIIGSVSDGVLLTGTKAGNGLQWVLDDVLSQANGGDGFHVAASPAGGIGTMGPWRMPYTFHNVSYGIDIEGISPSSSINDVQITDGFLGADCNSEINLNTYGGAIVIANNITELTGSWHCPARPLPRTAHGLAITHNNDQVLVTNNRFGSAWSDGISSNGRKVSLVGNLEIGNGRGGNPAYSMGIAINEGDANIIGGISSGNAAYGLYVSGGNVSVSGLVCSANQAGKHGGRVTLDGGAC